MPTLKEKLRETIARYPGHTDRELANLVIEKGAAKQPVNIACRGLRDAGEIVRRKRPDGLIGNFPSENGGTRPTVIAIEPDTTPAPDGLSEDQVKQHLQTWLKEQGWQVDIAWGRHRGVDIHAVRGDQCWIIEAKGAGSRQPMHVNYFLSVLGETLQRMDDPDADYSIAMPDMPQFRGLWERLPEMARRRTKISAIFVDERGKVDIKE